MTVSIEEFKGTYRFLSNFYIEPDGTHVEGEYQAQKCADPKDVSKFRTMTPYHSRREGRRVTLRADWEKVKREIMWMLVCQKFMDHPVLRNRLLDTGNAELVEGNDWGDRYWGVCRGIGENHLGNILMEVREAIRKVSEW